MESHAKFKQLDCGCEVKEDRLVSICGLHGAHLRQNVEAARGRADTVDKALQKQLVVAIAPIVVSQSLPTYTDSEIAEKVHNSVHEIMRRMD